MMMFLPSVGVWKRKKASSSSSSTDDDSHSDSVAGVLRGPNANGDIVVDDPSEVHDESRYEDEECMVGAERRHYLAGPERRQEVDLDDSVGRDDDGIADRLCKAKQLGEECRLLCAASLIEDIDPKYYELEHHNIMRDESKIKAVLRDCSSATSEDDEWTKQVEQHGKHEFSVYTKMDVASNKFSYRLTTPIEASMLIPILSVFNETELFITWFPRYKFPKYQMTKSEKLVQLGRASQIVLLETENQWPIPRRELLLKAVSCVNLQEDEESRSDTSLNTPSRIVVSIESLDTESDGQYGLKVSPSAAGKRVAVDAGLVFEASPEADSEILFTWTFSMTITKKFALPLNFFNFLLKFAMPRVWVMLLRVAEEIKDGKRREHIDAIQRKRGEFYDWMEECVSSLLGRKYKDGTRMMLNEEDSDSNCTKCFSLGNGRFSPAGVVKLVDASAGQQMNERV